ncbi:type III secretion system gatekeeper subunit SctW [Pseudomonas poae]|uniref:SepL/TyeA/HrpJ family type III secretion system gatekeeper n=1 Tax=Pseudomonas poae TaxID=200451 RepID=A0A2S9EP38_9PSED|nr:type III secretion system gatekeeper subunit SctW [Pseudomonas poae]PRA26379.1 SepL/TyeA/HrpJ family type III secretion system gatekeeper [Pseudomonas poae]PRC17299.1 SepL/TyeA/HrpJ family type III secretion system gatekeeper [Pseudomonas poae]
MKVESVSDVQALQSLALPAVESTAHARASAAVPGVDNLANLFNQEVVANGPALNPRSMGVRVTPLEQLPQLYDQLGHPAQRSLAALSRQIRLQLSQQPSVDRLLELTGNDPARTYVVLRQVTAQAEAEVRRADVALARDALARLEVRYEREIRAGLNIAMALQAATDDPQERQAVRALYYASVVVRQSLAAMMQSLLGVYGGEQFAAGLNVMRRALADDIAARASSIPCAKLRTLLLGLQSCGQLGSVLSNCEGLIQRLKVEHDAVVLLQRLLGYAGGGIACAEVQRLAGELTGESATGQLVSLNGLYPLLKGLPLALWRDNRGRQDSLHNVLLVMEELTRLEKLSPRTGDASRANV